MELPFCEIFFENFWPNNSLNTFTSGLNQAVHAKATGSHMALHALTLASKAVESYSKAQKMWQVF